MSVSNTTVDPPALPTTVKASLREAVREFHWLVDDADEPSASDRYQSRLVRAVTILLRLWSHIQDDAVLTRYETLRDFSDTAMELLPVPYYLGILCEKRHFDTPEGAAESREQQINVRESDARKRSEALLTGSDFLLRFLRIAVDLGLTTERDVETKPFIHPTDRQSRVQLSRERSNVEKELKALDTKLEWARQRALRDTRGSSSEDSDDELSAAERGAEGGAAAADAVDRHQRRARRLDEAVDKVEAAEEELLADSNDYAETKRIRTRRFLDWCVLDAFSALNQNNSELEMLGQLTAEEKQTAVENFRKSVEGSASPFSFGSGAAPAADSSFSLLRMAPPGAASMSGAVNAAVSGDVRMALQQLQMPAGGNYQVLPGGHVVPFGAMGAAAHTDREQVRRDAFLHRNLPTQTLAEFAAGEMEKMRQDTERQQAHNEEQALEDARLGADGVEERERQKQAEWDNWRDANPPIGISAKGNYS